MKINNIRNVFKKQIGTIFAVILLVSCTISNPKFFAKVQKAEDISYGYTAENPITIKNANLGSSINSSYYYLSRLRTENGNRLQLIMRYSLENQYYKEPLIPVYNRYTGKQLNLGKGPILDLYILKPVNENDTIRIYINPYLKGEVKIPYGLEFEKE